MRPSAGYINVCTQVSQLGMLYTAIVITPSMQNLINAGKAMNSELFFNLVLHELSHAFGFSASLFPG